MTEKTILYKIAKEVFEEATMPVLGQAAYEAICFHLKQRIGREPNEALVDEPKKFYEEFENILSSGADVLLSHVGKCIADKYGVSCSSEEFVEILYRGDESSKEKIVEIMSEIHEKTKMKQSSSSKLMVDPSVK